MQLSHDIIHKIIESEALDPETDVARLLNLLVFHLIEHELGPRQRETFYDLCKTAATIDEVYTFARAKIAHFDTEKQAEIDAEIERLTAIIENRLPNTDGGK